MKQLRKGIYQIDTGQANVFVLQSPDGLTLIDTSVVGVRGRLESTLTKAGLNLSNIKRILITHAHVDHMGGAAELHEATGALVWVHARDAAVVRGEQAAPRPLPEQVSLPDKLFGKVIETFVGDDLPSAPVHRELNEGDVLDEVWPHLSVVHLPGHSPGQVGFWLPEEKLLIGGDVMMHLTPWLTRPLAAYTPDMAEADRSIQKVAELGVQTLGVGHGPALIGNAGSAINKLAAKVSA